jgi:CHAT domain-containing protein
MQMETAVRRLLWDVGAEAGVDTLQASRWEAEGGSGYPFDRKTAFALYRQLVAPVADVLAGKRHIFIASGGVLSSLPFGILVTEAPQGGDGDPSALRATKWLADAYTLAVIPSVQSLQLLRRARGQSAGDATTSFAGYGDPSLEGQAESRGSRSRKTASARSVFRSEITALKSLARLPGTAVELENMRAALGAPSSSVHVQREATEGAVKSADFTKVRMLALATHGLMAGELRGVAEPGLVFSPPAKASEQDDGLLTASEIATLKLNADWVILSACNTAAGDGSKGAQGLSGLARAFFFAGARNLLVSHWPVRDDVAARITVDTIRRKQSDPRLARAEALQQAMRAIRNDTSHDSANDTWAHPNAWAPFSLIGDGAR